MTNSYEYKDRKYDVVPYDPNWPSQFEMYAKKIREILGNDVHIEHIGSTAVPGMAGKPCIDVLVVIKDLETVDLHAEDFVRAGFDDVGQMVMKDSRLFRVMKDNVMLANIHVFPLGHPHILEMIGLRDYFRRHPKEVTAYSNFKSELFSLYPKDYVSYRIQKDAYLSELLKKVQG